MTADQKRHDRYVKMKQEDKVMPSNMNTPQVTEQQEFINLIMKKCSSNDTKY